MINSYSIFSQIASRVPSKTDAVNNTHSYVHQSTYFANRYGMYILVGLLIMLSLYLIIYGIVCIYKDRNSAFGISISDTASITFGTIFLITSIIMGITAWTSIVPKDMYTAYHSAYVHKAKTAQIDTPLLINNSNQISSKIKFNDQSITLYHQTNMIKKHPIVKITKDGIVPYDKTGTQYIKLVNRAYKLADDNNVQLPIFTTDDNSNLQLSFSTNSKNYKISFKQQKIIEIVLN